MKKMKRGAGQRGAQEGEPAAKRGKVDAAGKQAVKQEVKEESDAGGRDSLPQRLTRNRRILSQLYFYLYGCGEVSLSVSAC